MRRCSACVLVLFMAAVAIAMPSEATNTAVRWDYRVLTELSETAFNELGGEGYELFYANSATGVFIFKRQAFAEVDHAPLLEYRVVTFTPSPDLDELGAGGWLLKDTYFGNYVFTRDRASSALEYFAIDRDDWLRAVEELVADQFGEQVTLVGQPFQNRLHLPSEPLIEAELVLLNRMGSEGWLLNERGTPGVMLFSRTEGASAKPLEYYAVGRDEWARVAEQSPTAEQELLNELGADGWYVIARGLPASIQAMVFIREQLGDAQWEYHVVAMNDWSRSVDQRIRAGRPSVPALEVLARVVEVQEEILNEIGADGWKKFGGSRSASFIFTRPKGADVPSWEYLVIGSSQWDQMAAEMLAGHKTTVRLERGELDRQIQEELLSELGAAGWEITEGLPGGSLVFQRPASR